MKAEVDRLLYQEVDGKQYAIGVLKEVVRREEKENGDVELVLRVLVKGTVKG